MIAFEQASNLRVLMIGDAIVDKYSFVKVTGKSAKDAILASTISREETYEGGIRAAAKHIEQLVHTVDVYSGNNIVTAQKFVEDAHYRKVFSVNRQDNISLYRSDLDIAAYDLVIVIDYGHGTMTKAMIERVSSEAKFLAVNAQTNGTNYGFNLITKYPRADYVVLDELEARLAARMQDAPIENVIRALEYANIVVTCGKAGAIGYDGTTFARSPAMTETVVDTLGAGDAFLAVTAPFAYLGASMLDLLRLGNAAGAVKVGIVGHKSSVTREALEKQLNG